MYKILLYVLISITGARSKNDNLSKNHIIIRRLLFISERLLIVIIGVRFISFLCDRAILHIYKNMKNKHSTVLASINDNYYKNLQYQLRAKIDQRTKNHAVCIKLQDLKSDFEKIVEFFIMATEETAKEHQSSETVINPEFAKAIRNMINWNAEINTTVENHINLSDLYEILCNINSRWLYEPIIEKNKYQTYLLQKDEADAEQIKIHGIFILLHLLQKPVYGAFKTEYPYAKITKENFDLCKYLMAGLILNAIISKRYLFEYQMRIADNIANVDIFTVFISDYLNCLDIRVKDCMIQSAQDFTRHLLFPLQGTRT